MAAEGSEPERQAWPAWVQEWVLPYVDDSVLWPVAVSLLGHVVIVIVPLMLQVWRHGSVGAGVLLAALLVGTVWLVRMEALAVGRVGALTGVLAVMWAVSFPAAWFAEVTGVL